MLGQSLGPVAPLLQNIGQPSLRPPSSFHSRNSVLLDTANMIQGCLSVFDPVHLFLSRVVSLSGLQLLVLLCHPGQRKYRSGPDHDSAPIGACRPWRLSVAWLS